MKVRTVGYEHDVPIDSIHPHPRNPNDGDVGLIYESVDTIGFVGAISVQVSTRTIVDGEHRWVTAKELGATTVPVLWVDLDDREALRGLAVFNRSCRMGHDDQPTLAALLADLAGEPVALQGTGFDGDDLDSLMAGMGALPDPFERDRPTRHCPNCGAEL